MPTVSYGVLHLGHEKCKRIIVIVLKQVTRMDRVRNGFLRIYTNA